MTFLVDMSLQPIHTDECIVALEHKTCAENCSKQFDANGCAQCKCDGNDLDDPDDPDAPCPLPQCAAGCRVDVVPPNRCPTCVCDDIALNFTDPPIDANAADGNAENATLIVPL